MKNISVKKLTKLGYLDLCITLQEIIPANFYVFNKEKNCHSRYDILKAEIKADSFEKDIYEINLLPLDLTEVYITMNNYNEALRRVSTIRGIQSDSAKRLLQSEKDHIHMLGSEETKKDMEKITDKKEIDMINIDRISETSSTNSSIFSDVSKVVASLVNNESESVEKKMEERNEEENSNKSSRKRGVSNYKIPLTIENVKSLYIDQNLSTNMVAEEMGVPKGTLAKFISDHSELRKGRGQYSRSRESSDKKEDDIKQLTHRDSFGNVTVISSGNYQRQVPVEAGGNFSRLDHYRDNITGKPE